jgi:hypothetical protein
MTDTQIPMQEMSPEAQSEVEHQKMQVSGTALAGIDHAIHCMTRDIGSVGLTNKAPDIIGGYSFRGINDALAALRPVQLQYGVNIIPSLNDVKVNFIESSKGTFILTTIDITYELVHAGTGTSREVTVVGQGMDKSDKGAAKAMSNAYKSFVWETFSVTIEDATIDAEASFDEPGYSGYQVNPTPGPGPPTPPANPASATPAVAPQAAPRAPAAAPRPPAQSGNGGAATVSGSQYSGITEPMAKRLIAAGAGRGQALPNAEGKPTHGFDIINWALGICGLQYFPSGSHSVEVRQHLMATCPPDPVYGRLYEVINNFDPAWVENPSLAPTGPAPVSGGAVGDDSEIPF